MTEKQTLLMDNMNAFYWSCKRHYSYCFKLMEYEDYCQEVFMTVFKYMDNYDEKNTIVTYIKMAVKKASISIHTKLSYDKRKVNHFGNSVIFSTLEARMESKTLDDEVSNYDESVCDTNIYSSTINTERLKEEMIIVKSVFKEMKLQDSEALDFFNLNVINGISRHEIAESVSRSEKYVRTRVSRVKNALKKELVNIV